MIPLLLTGRLPYADACRLWDARNATHARLAQAYAALGHPAVNDGYHPAGAEQCDAVASTDDWGWALVRCTKQSHATGSHISEGHRTFGGVPFTAIWRNGEDKATRYYHTVAQQNTREELNGHPAEGQP